VSFWPQVDDVEPVLDGKSSAGDCLGELSFFFGMRQIYTAKAFTATNCFMLKRTVFQQVLKLYPDEEDAIATNAMTTYQKVWNRAESQASGKSAAESVKSVQETMDGIIGGNLKQTIAVLRNRRRIEAIERLMKLAARNNITELAKRIKGGISVNSTNRSHRTCLHLAACNGHVELAKVLIETFAADVSIVDSHGNTPMNDAGAKESSSWSSQLLPRLVSTSMRCHGETLNPKTFTLKPYNPKAQNPYPKLACSDCPPFSMFIVERDGICLAPEETQ